jgi:hypothetical protein
MAGPAASRSEGWHLGKLPKLFPHGGAPADRATERVPAEGGLERVM